MKSVTDAVTVASTSTFSFGVMFGYVTQGMAFISLLLGMALTIARLYEWWEERKNKAALMSVSEQFEETGSSEMDGLFY